MGRIKDYMMDLAYRTSDAVKHDIADDLLTWHFGEDIVEYFLDAYSDGRMDEVHGALMSAKGDMPSDEEQPHVDAIILEIERWLPALKTERMENEDYLSEEG